MSVFLYGALGGFAINILRLIELQSVPRTERPDTFSDPLYLVQFIFLPLLGGILALAYQQSGTQLNPILAINIGASAPLIFKNFAAIVPPLGNRNVG